MMPLPTILILGSNGQLGRTLYDLASQYSQYNFVFADRQSLDINDRHIEEKIKTLRPVIVINAAAYTAVDKAEVEVYEAMNTNAHAVARIAKGCQSCGALLIHISSDYVYHSLQDRPLLETDETMPKNIYAISKLYGEKLALYFNSKTIVIRSSWIYAIYGNNFVKTMLRLGATNKQLTIVSDQKGAPTNAADLAAAIMAIASQMYLNPKATHYGVYNFANEGQTSWMEFARAIFEIQKMEVDVQPTTTVVYNAPAIRPLWSVMDMTKIKTNFGLSIPYWRESLADVLAKL